MRSAGRLSRKRPHRPCGEANTTTASAKKKRRSVPQLPYGCLRTVCGRQLLQLGLLLGQLDPTARDLKQISSVLLIDLLRHIQTLGRTIKVEITFRLHVPPFWYLWPIPGTWTPVRPTPGFQFKGSKRDGRAGVGARPNLSTVNKPVDPLPLTRNSRRNYVRTRPGSAAIWRMAAAR